MKLVGQMLILTVLGSLSVLALDLRRELALANAQVSSHLQGARRAQVIDRLVGRRFDDGPFLPSASGAKGQLLWVLDMDGCSGCFDSVNAWNALVEALEGRYSATIVVSGTPSPSARLQLRAARSDTLLMAPHSEVREVIGNYLPNTKLVIGADAPPTAPR